VPTYETVFITVPTLTEDEERTIVDGMAQIVTDGGGDFTANDRMGRRRLAYPIQKFEDGVYTLFLYDSESDVPKELDRRFRLSDKILRHLTVRLEPDWAVAAKEQAVRDAKARVEAEAARKIAEAEAEAARKVAEAEAAVKAEQEAADRAAAEAAGETIDDGETDAAPSETTDAEAEAKKTEPPAEAAPEATAEAGSDTEPETPEAEPDAREKSKKKKKTD
jgi:small subunit ribosomal protein S6